MSTWRKGKQGSGLFFYLEVMRVLRLNQKSNHRKIETVRLLG
jgi:hypothetical protein